MIGLQPYGARLVRAPGASCDLHDQLAQPLASPKVDAEQALINADQTDDGEIWQIVSFGQHLRADQNSGLIGSQLIEQFVDRILAACRLAIDAHDRRAREQADQRLLHALGAESLRGERGLLALRTL